MVTVTTQTLGECWLESIQSVLKYGESHNDEDIAISEILGLSLEIAHPSSSDSLIARLGDGKVIDKMLKKFSKGIIMEDRPFTYGQLIYDMNGVDQFEWILKRLKIKPETKSATVSLLPPGLDGPNLPCLNVLDVKIRDDQLHLQFFFRSQNIFGRQYANLLAIAGLQEGLARRIGCEIGTMKGYVASAHIYEYDLQGARELLDTQSTRVRDHYYTKGPASIRT